MKIKRVFVTLLAGIVFTGSILAPNTAVQTAKAGKIPSGPSPKSLSSSSAIVMELSTGTVLYEKNVHKHLYPASITKIMTALLTLDNCSLSEVMTVSRDAAYGIEYGSSSIGSIPGEKFTIEQALYAIMLESSNETCLALAEHIAGSTKNFANMMNDRVASLGLKDTHFTNPNGLHDDQHYTSAYDMACIAREAWKNKTFQKITGTKSYTMSATNKRKKSEFAVWLNHHQMLNGYERPQYEYKYCIGGKTGYTSMAHSTLVTFAEKDGMQLVSVIMRGNSPTTGEPNEYTDSTRLLNYGFANYTKYSVNEESSSVNENLFNTFDSYFNADASPVHLAAEAAVVLPKGVPLKKARQKITYDKNVTLAKGENVIGQVTYTYKGKTVGSTDILYNNEERTSYLDQASRNIVTREIAQIETKNAHRSWISRKFSRLKMWMSTKFTNIKDFFVGKGILLIVLGLILLLIILMILRFLAATKNRRRRSYSERQRKAPREHSKNISFGKRRLRNRRGTDYTGNRRGERRSRPGRQQNQQSNFSMNSRRSPRRKGEASARKKPERNSFSMNSRRQKKNSRRTRESFGKNFFDF